MPPRAAQPGRSMDERKEFFRDLAALRARRGLSLAEIAERTQFPADTLAAVESGPEVPPLPALEAYLRGCGEPLATWEDRWRQLDQGTAAVVASDGDLPVREAGTSPLASAGAALAGAAAAGGAAYTIKRLGNGGSRKRLPGTSRPGAASWPAAVPRRRVSALSLTFNLISIHIRSYAEDSLICLTDERGTAVSSMLGVATHPCITKRKRPCFLDCHGPVPGCKRFREPAGRAVSARGRSGSVCLHQRRCALPGAGTAAGVPGVAV